MSWDVRTISIWTILMLMVTSTRACTELGSNSPPDSIRSARKATVDQLSNPADTEPAFEALEYLIAAGLTGRAEGSGYQVGVAAYDCDGDLMLEAYASKQTVTPKRGGKQTSKSCIVSECDKMTTVATGREDGGAQGYFQTPYCTQDPLLYRIGDDLHAVSMAQEQYCTRTDGPTFVVVQKGGSVTDHKDGIVKRTRACDLMGPQYSRLGYKSLPDDVDRLVITCPQIGAPPQEPTPTPAPTVETDRTKALGGFAFKINCDRLTTVPLDPIVRPGQLSGHSHDIIGNVNFDSVVTAADLSNDSETTCDVRQDHSMYWFPSLYIRGDDKLLHLPTSRMVAYYLTSELFNDPIYSPAKLHTFPLNLRMVAGNSKNVDAPLPNDPDTKYGPRWRCHIKDGPDSQRLSGKRFQHFPGFTEPGTGARCTQWQVDIPFPSCWDGVHLDSPDHRSHMAYPVNQRCPESHPVMLPRLLMEAVYHFRDVARYVTDASTADYMLATGDTVGGSAHGDVIMGWDTDDMVSILQGCNAGRGDACPIQLQSASPRKPSKTLPDIDVDSVSLLPPRV